MICLSPGLDTYKSQCHSSVNQVRLYIARAVDDIGVTFIGVFHVIGLNFELLESVIKHHRRVISFDHF